MYTGLCDCLNDHSLEYFSSSNHLILQKVQLNVLSIKLDYKNDWNIDLLSVSLETSIGLIWIF